MTVEHVLMSLVLDMTPNSSTLLAKKIEVGASSNGSTHFKEF